MEKQHLGRSVFNVLLTLLLVWGLSPVTAWADEEDTLTLDDETTNTVEENIVALNDKAENTAQGYTLMETELTSGWNQSGTCEWMIDDNGLLTVRPLGNGTEGVLGYWESDNGAPWYSQRASIKTVKIEQGVQAQTCSFMFSFCSNLTSADLSGLDTQNVTNMSHMFNGCKRLTSLDLSSFNTRNVTNMSGMFFVCRSLTSLDVSGFDTSSVTYMGFMFMRCSSLTSLDVSGFDTRNVTDMSLMFYYCERLTSLDLSGFDTSSVTGMFYMFDGCSSLTSLDVSGFDTSSVTNMDSMFYNCSSLKSIYASDKFVTKKVTNSSNMFNNCNFLVGGNGTAYNSANIDKTYARIDAVDAPGYFTLKSNYHIDSVEVNVDDSFTLEKAD